MFSHGSAAMLPQLKRLGAGLFLLGALAGCSVFSGKPALPQHASIAPENTPLAGTDFAALVANAEILYFPTERAASGGRGEPSARLVEALRQNGAPFAIGWDLIEAAQQPLLDELSGKSGAAREELIARLEFSGTGRAREHCRAVLRDARLAGLRHLALRLPPALVAALDGPARLTAEEERQLPSGYVPPSGGFDSYSEKLADRGLTSDSAGGRSYRAQMARQQFAADQIVRHLRAAGTQSKLVVFTEERDLEPGLGVPRYVAQKLKVRQAVLDSNSGAAVRPRLLTQRENLGRVF